MVRTIRLGFRSCRANKAVPYNVAMSNIPLKVNSIKKRYGKHTVLDGVNLQLMQGEIFGLIGLNGIGKTTLIKILLDLARADSGEALIYGVPSTSKDARAKLSYLPEKFSPSRYLLGREYLSLALSYYGKKLNIDEAKNLADSVDLKPAVLDAKVGSYSKGMGQKLGLLGAFMLDQPFLILDEPMSGLDPSARIKLKRTMLNAKQQGKTIFFSSHILADIDEICDRIAIIHNTQIIYLGTAADFKPTYGETSLEEAFLKAITNTPRAA
jgi:ABC-2 type transport system ATP-binding protein